MIQYTWTYITSVGNNPSRKSRRLDFQVIEIGERWLSVLGMNESQLRVAVTSLFQAPSQ